MTRCAPVGSWLSTALHAAMPDENDTAWPPSSPPRTSSKASQVSVASVRLYRRSAPSTKFDAGTSGVFRGAPGTRSGRPPTMAQVSGFMCLKGSQVATREAEPSPASEPFEPSCDALGQARDRGAQDHPVDRLLRRTRGDAAIEQIGVIGRVIAGKDLLGVPEVGPDDATRGDQAREVPLDARELRVLPVVPDGPGHHVPGMRVAVDRAQRGIRRLEMRGEQCPGIGIH